MSEPRYTIEVDAKRRPPARMQDPTSKFWYYATGRRGTAHHSWSYDKADNRRVYEYQSRPRADNDLDLDRRPRRPNPHRLSARVRERVSEYGTYTDEDLRAIVDGTSASSSDLAAVVLRLRKMVRDLGERADREIRERLRWRHVEDPCETCTGAGVRMYGNSATWRGGAGAASCAVDVCDTCWGTGDRYRRGLDLRALRDEERARIAKAAATALVDACGARFPSATPQILNIITHLEKLVDGRGGGRGAARDVITGSLAQGLANLLRRAIRAPERKL